MRVDELFAARERAYRGEGSLRRVGVYNSVDELLGLRESGYLVGPDDSAIRAQKFGPSRGDSRYRVARPGVATAHHWTADEMESVKRAYERGEHVDRIRRAFPVETAGLGDLKRQFSDPDLFGAWNEGGMP